MIITSIIVPIYNVEKYLPACLDSLINQTLKEIEIICVNDGSPDGCKEILEQYQAQDSRIVVINQPNAGQGSARNQGLKVARGKYIQFLDSDDTYDLSCCEAMYKIMESRPDINVACFGTHIIYEAFEEKKSSDEQYFRVRLRGKQKVRPQMLCGLIDSNCWNKIFRKSFLDEHSLRFPEGMHYEDVNFLWSWIVKTNYIFFHPKELVNYRRREGSFLGEIYSKTSQSIFDAFKVLRLIHENLTDLGIWEEYRTVFIKNYIGKFRWLIKYFPIDDYQSKRSLIDHCAGFLSTLSYEGIELSEGDKICLDNILNRNYYLFSAYRTHETENIEPISDDSVNIVFSTDLNYIPFLSVAIQSIIENCSDNVCYDIIILYDKILEFQKRFILSLRNKKNNISIRFCCINSINTLYNTNNLLTLNHITKSAYYRLYVGKLFHNYKKILYLDCDLVVTRDVAELFHTDIGNFPVAAVPDTVISNSLILGGFNMASWAKFAKYMFETFGFSSQKQYFNSGVMIFDIERYNDVDFDYLWHLAEINNKFFHDQNVLNVAFENNYYKLPNTWNFQWNAKFNCINECYKKMLTAESVGLYDDFDQVPSIIHYTSHVKPWTDPYHSFANIWWDYARKTPFYEIIFKRFLERGGNKAEKNNTDTTAQTTPSSHISFGNYLRYKILQYITFGITRKHYKLKYEIAKKKLKNYP